MNNQLYIIVFWMLASCGMPVSSLYHDKTISVISAEKTEWAGGRSGVKGIMYTVKLKKNNNSVVTVKTLRAEGNTISFSQDTAGGTIIVRGNLQFKNEDETKMADQLPIENPVFPKINPKDNWIEYNVEGFRTLHRINISKFTAGNFSGESAP
ncbi:hypothetical protein [Chryseobacterium sp. WLY505]|uniref:hypothetical protein n=1 Tax=Chryseobacterium sp. WLY505 TaxID=3068892 RepID=UPI002796A2E6|nr:hypothetical protein [Chryseobacterium sp. WLY505]MDQ1855687.1 hypothetical protein [Chryseobacterium sp. WLY505]